VKFDRISIPNRVEKQLRHLPKQIREKFYWCLDMLQINPRHPSLRNWRIEGSETDWEFSITMNYRAVYMANGKELIIKNIGKHEDVF
jgi:mRNA-degrading endonuclease RelE of RelBE toxin-antitoxin system